MGTAVGAVVAFIVLLCLDALGITGSIEGDALHGWIVFVAVVWLCPIVGLMIGMTVGWRRHPTPP